MLLHDAKLFFNHFLNFILYFEVDKSSLLNNAFIKALDIFVI